MSVPAARICVRRLPHGEGLPLPAHQTPGAAGIDLLAALPRGTKIVLEPGGRHLVQTGIALAIPEDYEAQVRPRSGLARDHGVTVLNAPGTIDSDYRGEVMVLLINHGGEPFEIVRGERIAQLVVAPVARAVLVEAEELSATVRASGGFGSTGRIGGRGEPR
jgi:dUTP pyrophosphatase